MKRNRTRGRKIVRAMATALAAAAVAMAAGCRGPQARGPEPRPVAPGVLEANGMEVAWHTGLTLAPGTRLARVWHLTDAARGGEGAPATAGKSEGALLVGLGSDNRIYLVDATTGMRMWSDLAAPAHETVWRPVLLGDTLWVVSTTEVKSYRASNGMRLRKIGLEFGASGNPATNGRHCFIPDTRGYLEAVKVDPKVEALPWHRWTEGSVTAGPVLDAGRVYFASQSGEIFASAQDVRRVLWEHQAEGPIVADLRVTEAGLVLAGSLDYILYAFQGSSGRLAWQYPAAEPVRHPALPVGKQVFLLTERRGLRALDAAKGRLQWQRGDAETLLAADEETVYILGRGNDLLALSRADGTLRFGAPLRRDTLAVTNETENGMVYLAGPTGQVMAAVKKREP